MECPFCHQKVNGGKYCSNCSKPLNPKWYQKNSPITITFLIVSLLFLAGCIYYVFFSGGNKEDSKKMSVDDYYTKANEAFAAGNIREMQICLGNLKQAYPEEDIQLFFDEKISSVPLVQASDLIQKYKENSVNVNSQYEGKLLRVSGIVTDIGEDITKTVYIELGNEQSSFYDIRCEIVDKEEISQAATLKKGDTISVIGIYEDYASMHPGLKNSYISNESLADKNESSMGNNSQQSNNVESGKTYSSILEEYTEKLKNATPILIEEYYKEAAENTKGLSGLAELSTNKISALAEIMSDGGTEMADIMYTTGSGKYSEYQEWYGKLYDVYMTEAAKINSAYMESAMG